MLFVLAVTRWYSKLIKYYNNNTNPPNCCVPVWCSKNYLNIFKSGNILKLLWVLWCCKKKKQKKFKKERKINGEDRRKKKKPLLVQ